MTNDFMILDASYHEVDMTPVEPTSNDESAAVTEGILEGKEISSAEAEGMSQWRKMEQGDFGRQEEIRGIERGVLLKLKPLDGKDDKEIPRFLDEPSIRSMIRACRELTKSELEMFADMLKKRTEPIKLAWFDSTVELDKIKVDPDPTAPSGTATVRTVPGGIPSRAR